MPDAAGAKRSAPQSDGRAGARVSPPAAASPDLTARDFLDADWTVHALRPGGARVVPTRSVWQAVDVENCLAVRMCGRAAAGASSLSGAGMRIICEKTIDNARRNAKIRT